MILSVWLNAFIPQTVSGYTEVLPAGPYKGQTAIPMPIIGKFANPRAIRTPTGFLTDQRGFSNSISDSHRMQSGFEIETDPSLKLVRTWNTTSGTTEVNMKTGAHINFANADMTRCSVYEKPGSAAPNTILMSVDAKASDPLVNVAADIDYNGSFSIALGSASTGKVQVGFAGKVDAFPAYDCYASFDGTTKTIFTLPPPPGNTVSNLLFGANTSVTGVVLFF